jgi:hypothetical protein
LAVLAPSSAGTGSETQSSVQQTRHTSSEPLAVAALRFRGCHCRALAAGTSFSLLGHGRFAAGVSAVRFSDPFFVARPRLSILGVDTGPIGTRRPFFKAVGGNHNHHDPTAPLADKTPAPPGPGLDPPPPLRPFYRPGSCREPRGRLQDPPGTVVVDIFPARNIRGLSWLKDNAIEPHRPETCSPLHGGRQPVSLHLVTPTWQT